MLRTLTASLAVVICLSLAGCGNGGGDASTGPVTNRPAKEPRESPSLGAGLKAAGETGGEND